MSVKYISTVEVLGCAREGCIIGDGWGDRNLSPVLLLHVQIHFSGTVYVVLLYICVNVLCQ